MKNIFVSSLRDEADEIYKLAKEFNLGIELLGFIEPYKIDDYKERVKFTKERLLNIEKRSIHGPFMDLFPASNDPEIIKVVKKRFLDVYETAKLFDAKHLVLHAGFIPKAFFPDSWLENCTNFWKDFLSHIGDDIEIHIENVCEDDYSLISELIKAVDSPIFSACIDIGHVNVHSSKTLEEWIKGLNHKIRYVHLHNNDGVFDKHNGLCKGEINILKTLELLEKYAPEACWSLETKLDQTEESVLWLEKNSFINRK